MRDAIRVITSKTASTQEKLEAAELVKESLRECLTIKNLMNSLLDLKRTV